MSEILSEISQYTSAVVVPDNGDVVTAASISLPIQALANRTKYLNDQGKTGGTGFPHALPVYASTTAMKNASASSGDSCVCLASGVPIGLFVYCSDTTPGSNDLPGIYYVSTAGAGGSWKVAGAGYPALANRVLSLIPGSDSTTIVLTGTPATIPTTTPCVTSTDVRAGDVCTIEGVLALCTGTTLAADLTILASFSTPEASTTGASYTYHADAASDTWGSGGVQRMLIPFSASYVCTSTSIVTATIQASRATGTTDLGLRVKSSLFTHIRPSVWG
jgi:hypothetical protein